MSDALRKAVQLVLALHDHPDERGFMIHLDPMAEQQLRAALAEPALSDADINNILDDWLDLVRDTDSYRSEPLLHRVRAYRHSATYEDCPEVECSVCAVRDCPYDEPLHYHHDGCPACVSEERKRAVLVGPLRDLQAAANGLSYREFCAATGWPEDDYSKHKFVEFQALGKLHVFDNQVLQQLIAYYQGSKVRA